MHKFINHCAQRGFAEYFENYWCYFCDMIWHILLPGNKKTAQPKTVHIE